VKRKAVVLAGGVALVLVAWWGSPHLLRRVAFFRVRQVELVGLRYLAPEQVLQSLALAPDRNLFDPSGPLVGRATALPGVEWVRVRRRLPATLRLEFAERVPVAFVPGPEGMVALDADARPLPYDPTAAAFELPVIRRADTTIARVLALVRATDSLLYDRVDAAWADSPETIVMALEEGTVLLRDGPTSGEIRAVEAVRRHLVERGETFAELDGRFRGWVVVRREPA
jgi:cell division septal protein FtsQ